MLEILYRVAEALNGAADADSALAATLELVEKLMGLPTSWVWLESGGSFFLAAARGLPPYLEEPVRMTGEPCWCLQAYRSGSLSSGNVMRCSRLGPGGREETRGLSTHASIRLAFHDRPLGVLNVATDRSLTPDELKLLERSATSWERRWNAPAWPRRPPSTRAWTSAPAWRASCTTRWRRT